MFIPLPFPLDLGACAHIEITAYLPTSQLAQFEGL